MTRFLTRDRIARWERLERQGLKQHEIARELGCSRHTLIRHRRRMETINPTKQRAGHVGAAKRWRR